MVSFRPNKSHRSLKYSVVGDTGSSGKGQELHFSEVTGLNVTAFLLTIEGFRKNTAGDLCSASSLSFAYSGTRFWPGGRSGLAFWTAATFSPCWCKRWRRIPAPTRGSEIWNMDTSSSLYGECLKKKGLLKFLRILEIELEWIEQALCTYLPETQEKMHLYVSNWAICFILGMISFQPTVMA